ncbi:hypothetical protein [Chitinimonas naiadis]
MHKAISIDPKNGHVIFGSLEITPETTVSDLGTDFSVSEERLVSVYGKDVPCRFANASGQTEGLAYELGLRFEHSVLVSLSIGLTDPSLRIETEADFYNALEPTRRHHERWLKKQLGDVSASYAKLEWGVVGVAQDKSDNIYIYLHNCNNTWASR